MPDGVDEDTKEALGREAPFALSVLSNRHGGIDGLGGARRAAAIQGVRRGGGGGGGGRGGKGRRRRPPPPLVRGSALPPAPRPWRYRIVGEDCAGEVRNREGREGCLAFHGAAANSRPHSLLWVRAPPPLVVNDDDDDDDDVGGSGSTTTTLLVETVIYASGGVVNLTSSHMCAGGNDVTSVDSTLVTRTSDFAHSDIGGGGGGEGEGEGGGAKLARGEAAADATAPRSVSALAWVADDDGGDPASSPRSRTGRSRPGRAPVVRIAAGRSGCWSAWSIWRRRRGTKHRCTCSIDGGRRIMRR